MPSLNPEVAQWIRQMGDNDQVIAYFAYQSLLEQVQHTTAPDRTEAQAVLATALGAAMTALAGNRQDSAGQAASLRNNSFLAAVASQTVAYQYPPRVRSNLARLLGYLPHEAAVPYLVKALDDLEARENARCSLECNPSEKASDALIGALDLVGSTFCVGVVNSLAKRKGEKVAAALRRAAEDPQPEVRTAALYALADLPDASHDAILDKATRVGDPAERRKVHIARVRLAETLRASGNKQAADRVYKSILSSNADEPQKKAARLALSA